MPIPLERAVSTLDQAAVAQDASTRFGAHAAAILELLSESMEWVEGALRESTAECAVPADAAAHHLVSRGGKRVRPMALLLSAACFGEITQTAREMAVVAELVHSATLLHDDVIDDGMERRGAPTARRNWGNGMSVLAGDLLLVHSIERTLKHFPEALPTLSSTLRWLVEGEVVQMRGRTELDVSERTYDTILKGKTASLFAWATRVGAWLGGAPDDKRDEFGEFGGQLGMAFQLVDDVLDYVGEDTGKTPLADLAEGKLTLPLVLALQCRPGLLGAVHRIHRGDSTPVGEVAEAVVASGACELVRERALGYTQAAIEILHQAPESAARDVLESVARQLTERTS
jgi:octaprenyl-diphosphate synthase